MQHLVRFGFSEVGHKQIIRIFTLPHFDSRAARILYDCQEGGSTLVTGP
jgi:hypothetical protein